MRQRLLQCAAALVLAVGPANARAQGVAPLTIHRAQIQAAGWGRVSELVQGATGWQSSDVEGFDATASSDGLPPAGESAPGAPEWIVLVDGQPVPTNLFGVHQMDLLPISIEQIDSVVVVSGPVVFGGSSSARGAIEIFSRRAARGLSGELTYEHGDETGDPGPFRYTPLASPNIEKIGPFGHAQIGYARDRWDLTVGLHGASLNTTDSNIVRRTRGNGPIDIDALTPTALLRVRALGGEHELLASRGEERGDLFVSNYQSEQSLRSTDTYVGASGSVAAGSRTSANYALATSTQEAAELPSGLPFTVGHQRRLMRGDVSVTRHTTGPWAITGGVAAQQWRLARGDTTRAVGSQRAYVRATMAAASGQTASVTLAAVHAPETVGPTAGSSVGTTALEAQIEARRPITQSAALRISLAHVHALEGESDAWIDRDVAGMPQQLTSADVDRAALGFDQQIRTVTLTLAANVARAAGWPLLDSGGPLPVGGIPIPGVANPFASEDAITLAGFGARLRTPDSGRVRGYLEFDHDAPISGDQQARDAEQASVRNQLRGQVAYVPFTDVLLGAGVSLASGTRWSLFPDASGVPSLVPPLRRVNASIEKWFWHRRIRAQYVLENLLDQPDRDHPFGAQWNLRFHAVIGAQFGFPEY